MTTAVTIAPAPILQFFNNLGAPNVGGTILTQVGGINYPTYQDSAGTVPLPNPIPLNSRGEISNAAGISCQLFLATGIAYVFTLFDVNGNQLNQSSYISTIDSTSGIALAASSGASMVGFIASGVGAVARTVQSKERESVSVTDYGALGNFSADDTAAIQAAINTGKRVFFPPGNYKITTPLVLGNNSHIVGGNPGSVAISAFGCTAVTVPAGSTYVVIKNLQFQGYTAAGVISPKTFSGIQCLGTLASSVNYVQIINCYLIGFVTGVNWNYIRNSTLLTTSTTNCTNGVVLFGGTINNFIDSCNLQANLGYASVVTLVDVANTTRGEGLMISNTLLAGGSYGLVSASFLVLNVSNCVIDINSVDSATNGIAGISLTDCYASIVGCWVQGKSQALRLENVSSFWGGGTNNPVSISDCQLVTWGTPADGLSIGSNNVGVSITGGSISCGVGGRCISSQAEKFSVNGVFFINPNSTPSIYLSGADNSIGLNTGANAYAQYTVVQVAKPNVLSWIRFNVAATVLAVNKAYNCSAVRNSIGNYTVTIVPNVLYGLSDINYGWQIFADKSAFNGVGVTVVSATVTALTFTTVTPAGALFDPLQVVVHIYD